MLANEVYAVTTYYLQNRAEVDAYVRQVEEEGQQIREKIEASQPGMHDLRERLLKRLEASHPIKIGRYEKRNPLKGF
jgi:hypothetical protein